MRRHSDRGVALIMVLAAVSLCSLLAVSFLMMSQFEAGSGSAYARSVSADELARGMAQELVAELADEARQSGANTNSIPLPVRVGVTVTNPRLSPVVRLSTNVAAAAFSAAFEANNVTNPPTNYATPISTLQPGLDGHRLSRTRWQAPRIVPSSQDVPIPNWIVVSRSGPTQNTSLGSLSDLSPTNWNAAIGRYAFVIYDVSGLLDANVAGIASSDTRTGQKGTAAVANLESLGLSLGAFFKWRDSNQLTNTYGTDPTPGHPGSPGLLEMGFTPQTNYPNRNQFYTRGDLVSYAADTGNIPENTLPNFSTFSRAANAPDIPQATMGSGSCILAGNDTSITYYNLQGQQKSYTVKKGQPWLQHKFPLSRLRWFEYVDSTGAPTGNYAQAIKRHFGLKWVADLGAAGAAKPDFEGVPGFIYTSPDGDSAVSTIKNLSQVPQTREPDFFEWLKTGIDTNSLGVNFGTNSLTYSVNQDSSVDFQLVQIGANIIDQAGSSDVPTRIASAAAQDRQGGPLVAFGVKNIPYLNEIPMAYHRPKNAPANLNCYFQFEFWNPHQNASKALLDHSGHAITQFRVRLLEGAPWLNAYVRISGSDTATTSVTAIATASEVNRTITPFSMNGGANNTATFDVTSMDFSEPRVLERGSRVNTVPLTIATCPRTYSVGPPPESPNFIGLVVASNTAANPGITDGTRFQVSKDTANFTAFADPATPAYTYPMGEKYFNATQLLFARPAAASVVNQPAGGSPAPITLVVEMNADGRWIPFETAEGITSTILASINYTGSVPNMYSNPMNWTENIPMQFTTSVSAWNWTNPGHGGSQYNPKTTAAITDSDRGRLYYGWQDVRTRQSFIKIDPRTRRWGLPSTQFGSPGLSMRETSSAFNAKFSSLQDNWDSAFVNNNVTAPILGVADLARNLSSPNNTVARTYSVKDKDVVRPADWAYIPDADFPSIPGKTTARPVILNRPFRSVAELGYVFRDTPWKTIDFFESQSADLGLLDVFCVEDNYASPGKVNPNAASLAVLQSLIQGSALNSAAFALGGGDVDTGVAQALAASLTNGPSLRSDQDVVKRFLSSTEYTGVQNKIQREAYARGLIGQTDTRTWNFLIDVIAQAGRYPVTARDLSQFLTTGERRYWVHVAIDRETGRVVDLSFEPVVE
ncbi:MAG: hypothetical protein PW734_09750 [Verrucomicrobium sp.]|nr:hypothetical protein [Verrucomicrobium sp.]